jgi:hypothetical protein
MSDDTDVDVSLRIKVCYVPETMQTIREFWHENPVSKSDRIPI